MSQNPYQASSGPLSSQPPRPSIAARLVCVTIGSILLLLLGLAVAALGMVPSDVPGFFLLSGLHLAACGMLGLICTWIKPRGPLRRLFCWTSMILNAALAVRIAMLVFDGTIRGPLIVAAPLLVGIPATINVVSAALSLRRWRQSKA
jgi:hypothetical protein